MMVSYTEMWLEGPHTRKRERIQPGWGQALIELVNGLEGRDLEPAILVPYGETSTKFLDDSIRLDAPCT